MNAHDLAPQPYGYVYRIRNRVNGKTYIGQRKLALDNSWRHYMGSGKLLPAAYAKYGLNSFTKEFLAYAWTAQELNELEVSFMKAEKLLGAGSYNLLVGAPVPKLIFTEAYRAKLAQARAATNRRWARERARAFAQAHGAAVEESFTKTQSATRTGQELGLSIKLTTAYLKASGYDLTPRNVAGGALPAAQKLAIGAGLRRGYAKALPFTFACLTCGEPSSSRGQEKYCGMHRRSASQHKESNRVKPLPSKEELERLYWGEEKSANAIGALFHVSGQTVRNRMRTLDVPLRKPAATKH